MPGPFSVETQPGQIPQAVAPIRSPQFHVGGFSKFSKKAIGEAFQKGEQQPEGNSYNLK